MYSKQFLRSVVLGAYLRVTFEGFPYERVTELEHQKTTASDPPQYNETLSPFAPQKVRYRSALLRIGSESIVAGTFHVPSAMQKSLVFEATAHGVCLLLSQRFNKITASQCVSYERGEFGT